MSRIVPLETVRSETASMVALWEKYPQLMLVGTSQGEHRQMADRLNALVVERAHMNQEMKAKNDETNALVASLYGINVRLRTGCKSLYGSDSLQYGQAGGTRLRDRKSPKRLAAPEDTSTAAAQ